MEPSEEVSDTVFVLAFHSQQPQFERWTVEYRFAAGSPTVPAGAAPNCRSPARQSGAAVAAGQLPLEIQLDLSLRKAEQAVRDSDSVTDRETKERVVALQEEHGLEPAPEDHDRHAQAWEAAGKPRRAMGGAVPATAGA